VADLTVDKQILAEAARVRTPVAYCATERLDGLAADGISLPFC
jgi:hypothetical protein